MLIEFNLPHVFEPGSSRVENARALAALLRCLVDLNLAYLEDHPDTAPLYQSGVYYDRTTWWEPIPALYARGFGDCKSLSAARIAELRRAKQPCRAVFRWHENTDGSLLFHILIDKPGGWEDPSKRLGMGTHENAPFMTPEASGA